MEKIDRRFIKMMSDPRMKSDKIYQIISIFLLIEESGGHIVHSDDTGIYFEIQKGSKMHDKAILKELQRAFGSVKLFIKLVEVNHGINDNDT